MTRLLLIFLTLLVTTPAYGLVIEFRQAAEVTDVSVTLGDIAVFDENSELSQALASQTVAQAPSPGQEITLHTRPITQFFTNKLQLNSPVEWRGAATVRVARSGVQVSTTEILGIIDSYLLQKKDELPRAEIRFIPDAQPLPFLVPAGELSWKVIPSTPEIVGSTRFSLIFSVDGRVRKNMSVRGNLEVLAPVVIAAKSLRKGTILSAQHLAMSAQDMSKLRNPCLDPKEIIGKKLTSSITSGDVISLHQVEFPPLVKKGELVRIIVRQGKLLLTATGVARSNGLKDQTIRVQNIGSKKIIYCRVAGPGVVEVTL